MPNVIVVFVAVTLAWPQDTDAARRAIAIVKEADGTIVFDEKAPGKPVISVNL